MKGDRKGLTKMVIVSKELYMNWKLPRRGGVMRILEIGVDV